MATDSVVEFKFGDGSDLCGVYVKSDTHPERFIPELRELFKKMDDDSHKYRLNWDYMVTEVVGALIRSRRSVKLISHDCRSASGVIYHTVLTPQSDDYAYTENPIERVIHIRTVFGGCRDVVFDGLLGDYSIPEEEGGNFEHVLGKVYKVKNQNGFNNALYAAIGCSENDGSALHYTKKELREGVQSWPERYPAFVEFEDKMLECKRVYISVSYDKTL